MAGVSLQTKVYAGMLVVPILTRNALQKEYCGLRERKSLVFLASPQAWELPMAVIKLLSPGDEELPPTIFMCLTVCSKRSDEKFGIKFHFGYLTKHRTFELLINSNTRTIFWLRTPNTILLMNIIDIKACV